MPLLGGLGLNVLILMGEVPEEFYDAVQPGEIAILIVGIFPWGTMIQQLRFSISFAKVNHSND